MLRQGVEWVVAWHSSAYDNVVYTIVSSPWRGAVARVFGGPTLRAWAGVANDAQSVAVGDSDAQKVGQDTPDGSSRIYLLLYLLRSARASEQQFCSRSGDL